VYRRDDEARNIAGVMRRYSRVLIGADWNCVSDARRLGGEHYDRYYDADPFAHLPWSPKLLGKCQFDEETGKHWADRRPMASLTRGGLVDMAAAARVPWAATVGYWAKDGISKRIDGFRASGPVTAATTTVEVADSEQARAVSDHLPVVCEIDVANIGVWEARRAQGK
jgi:hypothetical protein